MSDQTDRAVNSIVLQQAREIQRWLASAEGRQCAERLLRRLNLSTEFVDDLLSDTWLHVERTFSRRRQPLDESASGRTEVRYAQRALEYTAIDILRAQLRRERIRQELAILGAPSSIELSSAEDSALHTMSTTRMIEACRDERRIIECRGCRPDVVREVAVRVLIALEHDPSQSMDDVIYEGLASVLGVADDGVRPDVLRARKARCGPCVTRLIRNVARELDFEPRGR